MEQLEKCAATLRYLRTVNGGRLTKWKGRIASCAPMVGLVVSGFLGANPAMAANECGTPIAPFPFVDCAGGTYLIGITYADADNLSLVTVILNDPTINVSSLGVSMRTSTSSSKPLMEINASRFGAITTSTTGAHGLLVSQDGFGGSAAITMGTGAGDIQTSGDNSSGAASFVINDSLPGTSSVTMDGGTITTTGTNSRGLYAYQGGLGDAVATLNGGRITTSGTSSQGVLTQITNTSSTAAARAIMNGGSIKTTGDNSAGVYALNKGKGDAAVTLTGGGISTTGTKAHGLKASIDNTASNAKATVTMSGGTVKTTGANSDGIYAYTNGSGTFAVTVTLGSVTSGTGQAAGIHTMSSSGGTINIGSGATINGSASSIAIRDGDANYDGVDETGGNVVVTTAGSVIGDAILGLGNDTFKLVGGNFNGNIYGDDKVAVAADGNDTFNWSGGTLHGGFYGGNGSDTANITATTYDGSQVLDGGDDLSAADGWIDTLNLNSLVTGTTIDGTVVTNWEKINLANSDVTINDLVGAVVTVTGSTLVANNLTANTLTLTNSDTTLAGASAVDTVNATGGTTTIAGTSAVNTLLGSVSGETIVVDGDATVGTIEGAGGSDSITVQGNSSVDIINVAGAGNDGSAVADTDNAVMVNTTGIVNTILGGNGVDTITLTSGTVGSVNAGSGNDVITADGADVTSILGGDGADNIALNSGTVQTVDAGAGNNIIAADGASVTSITGGAGDDIVTWSAGTVGSISLGDGSDTLTVSASTYDGSQVLDGGDDASPADGFVDSLTLSDLAGTIDGNNIINWEEIAIANSDITLNDLTAGALTLTDSDTTLAGASAVDTVNANAGSTRIAGTSAVNTLLGSTLDDVLVVDGDATVGTIEGAGGSDNITVQGNSSVDTINVAGAGNDSSAGADTDNTVVVNTTGAVNSILGGNGVDDITLTSGTVGTVDAGAGSNVITADGAHVTSILGGSDDDTVTWSAGTVGGISLGDGSDNLFVGSSAYDGSQVLDGGDDLSTADGWADTLTIKGVTATTDGANLKNWENIIIDGSNLTISDGLLSTGSDAGSGLTVTNVGILGASATLASTGLTITHGGILNAGTALALMGNMTIDPNSTFKGTGAGAGVYSISGDVTNNGSISTFDGAVGDTVMIAGNYTGSGKLLMDVNTATATADTFHVMGNTSGTTQVVVNNVPRVAATRQTINLITVDGNSSASDFTLLGGSLTAGAYDYALAYQAGSFFLSPELNSTGAIYEAAPVVLANFNRLPTLEERVGQRQFAGSNTARSAVQPSTGAWVRMTGDRSKLSTDSGNTIDNTSWGIQIGWDALGKPTSYGQWALGVTTQYGTQDASVTMPIGGSGSIRAEGYGVGATATWYGNEGTYADIQGQMNWVNSNFASSKAGSLADGKRARTHAESVEVGHRIELNPNNTLVPQAQLTAGHVISSDFTDSVNNEVDLGSNSSLVGRVGLAYQYENNASAEGSRQRFYAIGNVLHNFGDDSSVTVRGADLTTGVTRTWGEVGVGSSVTLDDNKTLYGSVAYRHSLDGTRSSGMAVTAGLRVQW